MPLYEAMVADLCASPHLPFEFATVLEDIGQTFMGLAEQVNDELLRRGLLHVEVLPEQLVETRVERMLNCIRSAARRSETLEADEGRALLLNDEMQRALRVALQMIHDLPLATRPC